MSIRKLLYCIIAFLCLLNTRNTFAQGIEVFDSIGEPSYLKVKSGPQMRNSVGSSFMFMPKYGSVSGLTASSFLVLPITLKLSVEGGVIAGRYFPVMKNFPSEQGANHFYNTLSFYGSANYQITPRLSLYGTGIKQLGAFIPFNHLPSSSYSFGSNLNFGNFTIGAEIRMTDWDNYYFPSPFGAEMGNFSSYPW